MKDVFNDVAFLYALVALQDRASPFMSGAESKSLLLVVESLAHATVVKNIIPDIATLERRGQISLLFAKRGRLIPRLTVKTKSSKDFVLDSVNSSLAHAHLFLETNVLYSTYGK